MNGFTTLKNRCAVVETPLSTIIIESWWGQWQCKLTHLACSLGYNTYDQSALVSFSKICSSLGATHAGSDGICRTLLTKTVEVILPNITNALMERYKTHEKFRYRVGMEFYDFENNAQIVRQNLTQFLATNNPPEWDESPQENVNDDCDTPLDWKDFDALATWMAEEIGGNYIMDKKSYKNQPPQVPYHFYYRVPITLWHEERTLLAMFIRRVFWSFWKTGKKDGFNSQEILRDIAWKIGLKGYERGRDLSTICWAFAKKFSELIKSIEDGDF